MKPTERKTGEIYFIRERDRKSGNHSPYVKIGMVRDTERGSIKRLEEHQTGNPRDLELRHVTLTLAPFRVERSLHQRFGPRRVRSEWFELNDEELTEAITLSESLANEMLGHLPIIAEAKALADSVSDGTTRPDSPEAAEWHTKLMAAKSAMSICKELEREYRSVHGDLTAADKADIQKMTMVVTEVVERPRFDETGFQESFPDLFAKFVRVADSVSGRFTTKPLEPRITSHDEQLTLFARTFFAACEAIRHGDMSFGDLFDLHHELETIEGSYAWDLEIAEARLRVLCGTADGIEGRCSWRREQKSVHSLDKESLRAAHPEEYEMFLTVERNSRVKTKKQSRRKS